MESGFGGYFATLARTRKPYPTDLSDVEWNHILLLEGVMNSSPYAIASRHGYKKTIPQRRFRRRVGICCSLPGTPPGGRPPAPARPARGAQRAEVDREDRVCLALHAPRPASVGGGLPANAAVAQSRCLRGDDPRSARTFAAFEGPGFGAFGGNSGRSHAEIHSRERPPRRLRRTQGQEGLQGACGGGHFGRPARPARESGQRGRPQAGGETLRGDTKSDRRECRDRLRRSRIHGREGLRARRRTWHPARSGQAQGGQARLRALAEEVGGGTRFRVGVALSAFGEGLREAARDGGGAPLRRVRLPLSSAGGRHPRRRFITRSTACCYEIEPGSAMDACRRTWAPKTADNFHCHACRSIGPSSEANISAIRCKSLDELF